MTDFRKELDRWLMRNPMPPSFPSREAKQEFFGRMPERVKREWNLQKARADTENPEYNRATAERAQKRMARVDAMPPDLRDLVYEHGLELVQEFINHGVRTASSIRHLINACRNERDDGTNFFRPNVRKATKPNPASRDTDDDFYFVARR